MADKTFLEGFFFERPREGAPAFVKGRMSIKVDKAVEFLQANANEKGYVNADLLVSKDNSKLYFTLNDYKPKEGADDPITPESVPF
jgi:hypothetical protein